MLLDNPPSNLDYGFPHIQRLRYFVEIADKIYKGDYERYFSSEIETFLNGASDHLYELEFPKGKKWEKVGKKINKLRKKGLHMGHGFDNKKRWTLEDVDNLFKLVNEIAVDIDKNLGIKAELGMWG